MVKVASIFLLVATSSVLVLGRTGGRNTGHPCRGKRQLCPKVSTKLLSRQQLWQLREGGGERTFTVIHRRGNGNSWVEAVVRESRDPGRRRRRSRKRESARQQRQTRQRRSQARTVVSLDPGKQRTRA